MKTLIIGAGLVGSQVARELVLQGERPVLMDVAPQRQALGEILDLAAVDIVEGSVLRPMQLNEIVIKHEISKIVHTVANPMLTLGAQRDPCAAIELNIMGTVNVLEAARIHKLGRVVVSSSNVLGHFMAGGAGNGNLAKEEAHPRPTTFYATTKQAIENIGLNYARWCDVDFVAVRYGAVCGPWSGAGGGGPSMIMREAVARIRGGEEAVVPQAGLEWVYAKDAGRGTVLALQAAGHLQSRVFNITMGYVCEAPELANALKAALPGARVRIETPAASAVSTPQMTHASDLTLAKQVLGYEPRYNMVESVRDLVAWSQSKT
ncbi:MAG: NAD-dependent epimerase/dehydratase family protein [Burkholderiales bacterium]